MKYLDDSSCAKVFPSSYDRNSWSCPINFDESFVGADFAADNDLSSVDVDTSLLDDVVTNGANVCAVVTRRTVANGDTKLRHKYFCAGERSRDLAYETWSRYEA